jgi:hypothetical protein
VASSFQLAGITKYISFFRLSTYGLWHHIILYTNSDVSHEYAASIYRVKKTYIWSCFSYMENDPSMVFAYHAGHKFVHCYWTYKKKNLWNVRGVCLLSEPESYVTTDGQSASLTGIRHPSRAYDQIFYQSESCGFVDVGRSLWREEKSVVYSYCWCSPAQSFWGPSPVGLSTIFYCLRFETSPTTRRYILRSEPILMA